MIGPADVLRAPRQSHPHHPAPLPAAHLHPNTHAPHTHTPARHDAEPCSSAQCLKYQTDQQSDLKRFEKLNNMFLLRMSGVDPHAADEAEGEPHMRNRAMPRA